jgi:hypothetical protein
VTRRAFVDESYVPRTRHYLLAAVVLDTASLDDARAAVRDVRRHRRGAFHWHDERTETRRRALKIAAATSDLQVVVVVKPVPERRQERARALCTASLLAQLQAVDPPVLDVVFESRTATLDRRDRDRIEGLRASRRISATARYGFATKAEPLLWLADAVAGAASLQMAGNDDMIDILGDRLVRIQIPAAL